MNVDERVKVKHYKTDMTIPDKWSVPMMVEAENGEWVKLSDHERAILETRRATLLEAAKIAANMYADVSELGTCTFIATELRQLAETLAVEGK